MKKFADSKLSIFTKTQSVKLKRNNQ